MFRVDLVVYGGLNKTGQREGGRKEREGRICSG